MGRDELDARSFPFLIYHLSLKLENLATERRNCKTTNQSTNRIGQWHPLHASWNKLRKIYGAYGFFYFSAFLLVVYNLYLLLFLKSLFQVLSILWYRWRVLTFTCWCGISLTAVQRFFVSRFINPLMARKGSLQ